VIASRNGDGDLDLSPRGDAAASFVRVIDQQTLAVPDRLGNRRLDTLTNLLDDPNMGMIFLVPGKRETLRISGTAQIVSDQWLREELANQGRMPDLAIVVTVNRLYFHCAKCMIRSGRGDDPPGNSWSKKKLWDCRALRRKPKRGWQRGKGRNRPPVGA
jgi:uncharacterized protein